MYSAKPRGVNVDLKLIQRVPGLIVWWKCRLCLKWREDPTRRLADTAFHLQLNQPIHLNCVFHRQFLDQWFNEAVDDHGACFLFGQSATEQVEQLLFADS